MVPGIWSYEGSGDLNHEKDHFKMAEIELI